MVTLEMYGEGKGRGRRREGGGDRVSGRCGARIATATENAVWSRKKTKFRVSATRTIFFDLFVKVVDVDAGARWKVSHGDGRVWTV